MLMLMLLMLLMLLLMLLMPHDISSSSVMVFTSSAVLCACDVHPLALA